MTPTDDRHLTTDDLRDQAVLTESYEDAARGVPSPLPGVSSPLPLGEGQGEGAPHDVSRLYSGTGGQMDAGRSVVDVQVVPELCMNFLNCMRIATGAFATDRQTRKTRPARWRDVPPDKLWKAALSCPSGAIRFITDKGYVAPRWEEACLWRTDAHPAAGRRREQKELRSAP